MLRTNFAKNIMGPGVSGIPLLQRAPFGWGNPCNLPSGGSAYIPVPADAGPLMSA